MIMVGRGPPGKLKIIKTILLMNVCVLGSGGFIGSNLMRGKGDNWVGITRQQLDLTIQTDVDHFFGTNQFDIVIHCAVVGGSRLQADTGDVCYKNLLMFENIVRHIDKFKKLIYFSSGATRHGNPPTEPYGLSKWIIDKRIASMDSRVYSLCIWGCWGPGELPTRFSAICKREGHITIPRDRYFDFINVDDIKIMVDKICIKGGDKFGNLVYTGKKLKLSEWATRFGATYTIENEGLDPHYTSLS